MSFHFCTPIVPSYIDMEYVILVLARIKAVKITEQAYST
jgi:hypothetical protein